MTSSLISSEEPCELGRLQASRTQTPLIKPHICLRSQNHCVLQLYITHVDV